MRVYLCIIGGHTASQVADSVSILNKVCLYRDKRNEAVYDSTKSLYMQLADVLRTQRQSKGTLKMDQV